MNVNVGSISLELTAIYVSWKRNFLELQCSLADGEAANNLPLWLTKPRLWFHLRLSICLTCALYLCLSFENVFFCSKFMVVMFSVFYHDFVVVVGHIYPPVNGQRQTPTVGRSAHFSLQWLLRGWRNPHLLRSFQWSNVPVNFFKFLSTKFAAGLKPPSRDNYRKTSYPRTQQRDQGAGWTQIIRSGSLLKRRLNPFGHAAD